MANNIRAVAFDLYGTLIYTINNSAPQLRLLKDLNLPESVEKEARRIFMTENFPDMQSFVSRIKPDASIDLRGYEQDLKKEVASTALYPETISVLEKLKQENMKISLVSNVSTPYKQPFFDLGLDRYFDNVIFSSDVGMKKPDAEIYMLLMDKVRAKPDKILMVGDRLDKDFIPPLLLGMDALLIDRMSDISYGRKIRSLEEVLDYIRI